MDWAISLYTFGIVVYLIEGNVGKLSWDSDWILFRNTRFTIDEFRYILYRIVDEVESILTTNLLLNFKAPSIL